MFGSSPNALLTRRGLWLLLALMLLAVQTGLPAHQDSHPLSQSDSACHYCMLGGHMPGMLGAAIAPVPVLASDVVLRPLAVRPAVSRFRPRPSSRAPPIRKA